MNATLGNASTAGMRASDADRDAVLSDLSEHFQAGRLTAEEFKDRAGQALAARTWGELTDLLRDLPSALSGPQTPVAAMSAASAATRPERRGVPAPIALLMAIGIAIAVSDVLTHSSWSFMWVVLVLFIVRRLTRHVAAPGPYGPRN
jgi:Domain of unknown function (DUF1707)